MKIEIKKCRTRGAYSVKPKKNVKLNLKNVKNKFKVVIETPIVLVIDCEGEIVVHRHGELLFKELEDKDKVEKIARRIYSCSIKK